jgi:hypothetical protein
MFTDSYATPSLLATPSTHGALATATPWEVAFPRLPGVARHKVMWLEGLMRRIDASPKKRPVMRQIQAEQGGKISAESLKRHYYAWSQGGAAALVDHRQCGGCGVVGCTFTRLKRLPEAVVKRWAGEAGGNDKQAQTEGWRVIMRELIAGKPVVDGVTWATVFMSLWPGLPLPAQCPWSIHHPPLGWSLANFVSQRPAASVMRALKKGASAAWNETPEVRMDMEGLRPFEAIVFDDHPLDFQVMTWDDRGKVQVVEMHGLFAMDVATGTVLEFGLRPAIVREDGTKMGLTLRDMQHLIAHMLNRYGFPLDYKMTLIVENAAAAVSAETERLLESRTNGQVVVRRTGVHFGAVNVRGFPERWGAPRGKAWLESWFHLLDIALGSVKGQKGSNWTVKPGHTDGCKWLAEKMAKVISSRPELETKLAAPLHWTGEAHWIVKQAIDVINHRTDHSMERHSMVAEWRYSPADPTPKPVQIQSGLDQGTREMVRWFQGQPAEVQSLLINNHGQPRRESPLEKMQRTWRSDRFAVIPADTFVDLLLDSAKAVYRGGDVIDIDVGRRGKKHVVRYVATEGAERLELGQEVQVRFDSEQVGAGAWVMDAKERFLGFWRHERDPRMLAGGEDLEILQRRLGAKTQAHKEIIVAASKLRLATPAGRAELAERDANMEVMEGLSLPKPSTVAEASQGSREIAARVLGQTAVGERERPAAKRPPRLRPLPPVLNDEEDDGFSFE